MAAKNEERAGPSSVQIEVDFVRMYYEHQYTRMAKLEDHRLAVTNVILALTVATFAFAFANKEAINATAGLAVPAVLVLANVFAIAYLWRTSRHIAIHQRRAKEALRLHAAHLYAVDSSLPMPRGPLFWMGTARMQMVLHVALIAVAAASMCAYLTK
jgi:hypothetical protein